MAGNRSDLHSILQSIMGNNKVYFQPPANVSMTYPCIVYHRSDIYNEKADNLSYTGKIEYEVILIDKNPDSEYLSEINDLSYADYQRYYASDGLNHDVFRIYY